MQKSFLSVLPKNFIRCFCEGIVNLLKGNLKSIKDITGQNFQKVVFYRSLKNLLKSKKRRSGIRERVSTHKNHYFSRHEPLVLLWSSLFLFLLLCTTTGVWSLKQLQSRSFQSIKLKKLSRTQLISFRRKFTRNCLPKQTLETTKKCLVPVSRSQIRRLLYWIMWKLEF